MKLLLENWRKYLTEDKTVFYVDVSLLLPTQEQGHGKDHDCPSAECEAVIQSKMNDIKSGNIEPLEVSNKKPIRPYRIQSLDVGKAPKSEVEEPFYHVLNGHHRLEAAKLLGVKELPVFLTPEDVE
tara:strand:- start:1134 stop:1511 length:378 start_codon:yes stop_codon:yes gene_type:complete